MAITITIGGASVTDILEKNSLNLSDDANARNVLRFQLIDPTATRHYAPGAEVIVLDGATRLFAGTIEEPNETLLQGRQILIANITAVDFNQLPDRFLVAETYDNKTIAQIATDLVTVYLAADSVTLGTIETGPTITRKVFNYVLLSDALNWLTEQTGYPWSISYTKVFTLQNPESVIAPFVADGTTCLSMRTNRARGPYRNKQYIRAGRDLTDSRVESFKGDGTRRTFNVSFPVGTVPTVTVDDVPKTVGIRGIDTGNDWYWNKDTNEISQDDSGAILTTSNTLAVTYRGLFPILVQAQLDAEIADRVVVEGGSGVYEAIEDHTDIDDEDLAMDTALARLARDGSIHKTVEIVTDSSGLAAGQLLTVNEAKLQLSGQFLVQSVQANDIQGAWLRSSATCISGDAVGGWINFYQKLLAAKRETVVRDNEVLLHLRLLTETIAFTDVVLISTAAPESRIGSALINYSEVAA